MTHLIDYAIGDLTDEHEVFTDKAKPGTLIKDIFSKHNIPKDNINRISMNEKYCGLNDTIIEENEKLVYIVVSYKPTAEELKALLYKIGRTAYELECQLETLDKHGIENASIKSSKEYSEFFFGDLKRKLLSEHHLAAFGMMDLKGFYIEDNAPPG